MKEDNIWKDFNWGILGLGIVTIGIFLAILKIGFWSTLMWLIIGTAIGCIIYKLKEERW